MDIIGKAVRSYDKLESIVGEYYDGMSPLAPVYHATVHASLEIEIDWDGHFVNAVHVPDVRGNWDRYTIVPCTCDSERVTSNVCAKGFADQLRCVADMGTAHHADYIGKLSAWHDSEYTTPIVDAVYKYVMGGTCLSDLDGVTALHTVKDGNTVKLYNDKSLVRWRIGNTLPHKDRDFMRVYERYYRNLLENDPASRMTICEVTGELDIASDGFPKNGEYPSFVSMFSNESTKKLNMRVPNADDAAFGVVAVSKSANLLKWAVTNYAKTYDDVVTLVWDYNGEHINIGLPGEFVESHCATLPDYRRELGEILNGCRRNTIEDNVTYISYRANTGRDSIIALAETPKYDFLKKVCDWKEKCSWYRAVWDKKKETYVTTFDSPSISDIIKYAYGTYRDGSFVVDKHATNRVFIRLMSAMVNGGTIPFDVVNALQHNLAKFGTIDYDKTSVREHMMFVACAVLRKYNYDRYGTDVLDANPKCA